MAAYQGDGVAALADPTRRAIVERLAAGPIAVGELARELPVSRPAVSQHLRVLESAGLVVVRQVGTRRLYQLDPAGIDAIRIYFEQLWQKSLAAFKEAAEQAQALEDRGLMTEQIVEESVERTVTVNVSVERAFEVFVEQFGTWWPPEFRLGASAFTSIVVEPRAGGRWFERDAAGTECDWGRVLRWDPPQQIVLAWQIGPDWKFDPDLDTASEVSIRFIPEGERTTRVELEHTGFERRGSEGEMVRQGVGGTGGWTTCLERYVEATRR